MATINEIKDIIAAADLCGHVPLIKGLHGLGKSESVAQYATEKDMHYEPLILSLMDTGDMLGLPVTERVNGMASTLWAAPTWYTNIVNAAWPEELDMNELVFNDEEFKSFFTPPSKVVTRSQLNETFCQFYSLPNDRLQILRQDKVFYRKSRRSVMFLDEFNRAPSDILNASLQLILDHRLHSHVLPLVNGQETLIVAAINPADGDYTVQEFDPALLDRFVSCEVTPDFKSWLAWAKQNNVNKVVTDFLIDNPGRFHFTPEDGTKGASPRSWTRLANYLDRIDSTNKDIMSHYTIGTVGSAIAAQFLVFYNSYSSSMSTKDLDKLIKKEIAKARKTGTINPEEIATAISDIVTDMDAVRRGEFAENFIKKYINSDDAATAMPMLVYLYALPMESLSAVLKSLQNEDINDYAQLAILDKEANNKGLFTKLVSNLKK